LIAGRWPGLVASSDQYQAIANLEEEFTSVRQSSPIDENREAIGYL
jgi:hypothetical protein